MPRPLALPALLLASLVARPADAAASLVVPAAGGRGALAVSVDTASRLVRYASCEALPCEVSGASATLPIPAGTAPIDPNGVSVEDVVLAGARHLAHVRVALGTDRAPEAEAWEALIVAGSPPLFAGRTGWSRGEPGERSGTDVRLIEDDGRTAVVVGDIREDLRICGDDATLLDPRGLDPATMTFRNATLQRLSVARREAAVPLSASARRGPAEVALARLLTATEASSALGPATALTDGDRSTAWSEAKPGRGQGEFVLMQTPFDVPIVRFAITVAPTSPRPEGAAPETFYLATGAATYEVTLPEDAWSHPGEAYDIALPQPLQSSCVALVLESAFTRGKAHPEVTVAEIAAYSAFDHAGATLAEVAAAMKGGNARAAAAAALLERAGAPGISAMAAAYPGLDAAGRALAINVAASTESCDSAAPLLAAALADGDEVVRGKATSKLEQPRCGREALPALTTALRDPATRPKVAPLVAFLGRERALGPLGDALGEGTPEDRHAVRSAVAFAAREAPPADVAASLEASARRSQDAAVDALRALRDRLGDVQPAADATLAAVYAQKPPLETRYVLVDVLAPLAARGDLAVRGMIDGLIVHDPAHEVRVHAAELLASAGQPEADATSALGDPEPRVREAALRAVGESHLAAVTAAVMDRLGRDPWTFVRVAAASTLASLPATTESDRALGDALDQISPRVREQAALALGAHGSRGYRDAVRRHLTDAAEDPAVRAASARALGQLCDPKAVDVLAQMMVNGASSQDAAEVALGLVATEALGAIHPRDLAARFVPLRSRSVRPDARAAAAAALEQPDRCALP